MKTTKKIAIAIGITSLATLPLMSGPVITVQVPAPVVTVQVPAPAVTVEAVPDTYVWDGVEYVGVVGGAYFYLGPGNVWLPFDSVRVARFHDWEKIHADWRDHAIRNEQYRHDAHGHEVPLHDAGQHDAPPSHDVSHDNNDKDHDHDH
jgi:hypothetical protein